MEDVDHDEERFVTIGQDHRGRVLIVAYHDRGVHELRLISARTAQRQERLHDERQANHARTR
ncbi:BrnT family toxin [Lamprobacter sp.]|uniref:BrnT family toxin n=1 Tax=Lamprobacter sp. TaxID=3100796 RepID=UPI003A4DF7F5